MSVPDYPNAGFDEFVEAVADGEGYYLACPDGHGLLPPRRVCPHCQSTDLRERQLPTRGAVETFSEIRVPTPAFEADAPYVVAIASFGPVYLTARLRGTSAAEITTGTTVTVDVETSAASGERYLVFEVERDVP